MKVQVVAKRKVTWYKGRFNLNRKIQDKTTNVAYFCPFLGEFKNNGYWLCVQKVSIKWVILIIVLNPLQKLW